MVLTDFYVAPVPFLRQLCEAYETETIGDNGATKMASTGKCSNVLLGSPLYRVRVVRLVPYGNLFHQEEQFKIHLQHKNSNTQYCRNILPI